MALTNHSQGTATPDIRRIALLAGGDALTFLLFAALGRASHNEAAGLAALGQVAETAAPFAIGWFLVAPFIGVFRRELSTQPRRMLPRTALAWLLALPLGLGLRALIRQSSIPLSFAITTFMVVLVMMIGWRAAYAWLAGRQTT